MAGDPFKKVKTGEPLSIPAEAYNAFVDAAVAYKTSVRTGRGTTFVATPQSGVVLVRNDSGDIRGQFDVLGLQEPIVDPTDNDQEFRANVKFKGIVPSDSYKGRFAILMESLDNGRIGRAVVSGVTVCKLNVIDESHEFADVHEGETSDLNTGDSGSAHVLWKQSGVGVKWGVVRLGNPGATTEEGDCISKLAGLDLESLEELSEAESVEDWAHIVITAGGCLRKATPQECEA